MSIKINHLTYVYGEESVFEKKALDDINLEINDGEFIGLIGHTGSGKSTLIQHLNGILKPSSGDIYINDFKITDPDLNLTEIRKRVGVVFQYPEYQLFEETIEKDIAFGPSNLGLEEEEIKNRVKLSMEAVGLDYELFKDKSPFELSGGQKRRVAIAGVIAMNPEVLILDEPTAGLDPRTRFEFKEILKELKDQGKTIVISSHILSELAELCTDVGIIDQGKMALTGSIDEILSQVNSSNPIVITLLGEGRELALNILKSHPYVHTITVKGQEIIVRFTGDKQDEAVLLQQLVDAGILITSFTREQGSLESLFMQITGKEEERTVLKYENESGL